MIWIVDVRNSNVTHIMQIAVDVLIRRQDASLHHVSKHVDTVSLGQRNSFASCVRHGPRVDRFVNSISPSFQILNVEVQLVDLSIDVVEDRAACTSWPCSTSNQGVQFREISFRYRFAPINESLHSSQTIAQTFAVVSKSNLNLRFRPSEDLKTELENEKKKRKKNQIR